MRRSSRKRDQKAFTLTEVLVSVTVLALLIVLVARVVNSATTLIERNGKASAMDGEARLIFNRIATDLGRMVRRTDVDFYGKDTSASVPMNDNDQIAFYTEIPGYYSSPSPTATPTRNQRNSTSLVGYCVANDISGRPQLVRMAKGLVWQAVSGEPWIGFDHLPIQINTRWPTLFTPSASASYTGMQDADFEVVSESVVRFEYSYVLRPTTTASSTLSTVPHAPSHQTTAFCNDVEALIVTIAVLDPTSRKIVTDYSKLTSRDLFSDANASNIAAIWNAATSSASFASSANIPKNAASGIRIYQRRVSLTANQP